MRSLKKTVVTMVKAIIRLLGAHHVPTAVSFAARHYPYLVALAR